MEVGLESCLYLRFCPCSGQMSWPLCVRGAASSRAKSPNIAHGRGQSVPNSVLKIRKSQSFASARDEDGSSFSLTRLQ